MQLLVALIVLFFGVVDLVWVSYDLRNVAELRQSQFFIPYVAVKCINFFICVLLFIPVFFSTLAASLHTFRLNFVISLLFLCNIHVESGLLAACGESYAAPKTIFRVISFYLSICTILDLWIWNTM